MWLSTMVGLAVAPVIALGASWLARALGGDSDVLEFATTYLRIGALGIPFVVFALGAQGVQRGASDYRTPLVILLVSNAVNAVLEVLFVYRLRLGCPGLGVVDGHRPGRCRDRLRRGRAPAPRRRDGNAARAAPGWRR